MHKCVATLLGTTYLEEVRMPGRRKTRGFGKNKITSIDLIFYSVMESYWSWFSFLNRSSWLLGGDPIGQGKEQKQGNQIGNNAHSLDGLDYLAFFKSNTSRRDVRCEQKKMLVAQSCPILCNLVDCSTPGSSMHGISQARILEWVTISFSRGSSQPRSRTQVSCIAGRFFTVWVTRDKNQRSIFCFWSGKILRVGKKEEVCFHVSLKSLLGIQAEILNRHWSIYIQRSRER